MICFVTAVYCLCCCWGSIGFFIDDFYWLFFFYLFDFFIVYFIFRRRLLKGLSTFYQIWINLCGKILFEYPSHSHSRTLLHFPLTTIDLETLVILDDRKLSRLINMIFRSEFTHFICPNKWYWTIFGFSFFFIFSSLFIIFDLYQFNLFPSHQFLLIIIIFFF